MNGDPSDKAVAGLIYKDCVAAMEYCLAWNRSFHKAHHRLAKSFEEREHDLPKAASQMRTLFQRKGAFGIAMVRINDMPESQVISFCFIALHASIAKDMPDDAGQS